MPVSPSRDYHSIRPVYTSRFVASGHSTEYYSHQDGLDMPAHAAEPATFSLDPTTPGWSILCVVHRAVFLTARCVEYNLSRRNGWAQNWGHYGLSYLSLSPLDIDAQHPKVQETIVPPHSGNPILIPPPRPPIQAHPKSAAPVQILAPWPALEWMLKQ